MPHNYEDDTDVKEKQSEAKKNVKIDSLRKKGMSERDAIVKGLVSMKRSDEEKEPSTAASTPVQDEAYPYGLRIRLENDELEKLGIDSLPEVGKSMKVTADAIVQSVSSNENLNGSDSKKSRCVELQITDLQMGGASKKEKEA